MLRLIFGNIYGEKRKKGSHINKGARLYTFVPRRAILCVYGSCVKVTVICHAAPFACRPSRVLGSYTEACVNV